MKAPFTPSRWVAQAGSQALFLACPIYEVLYHGTRGPGKTDALLADFLKDVGKGYGPAWRGILFRRTFPQLADVIERSQKMFKMAFPGAKYNTTKHEWRFPGGETLLFRFAEKTKDYDSYHGWEVAWLAFEELCTWPSLELYLKLQGICRSSHPEVAPIARVRATANPLGVGHNVVKRRFQLGGSNHTRIIDEGGMKRCAIFGHLRENKILLASDPHYEAKLRAACKGNPIYIKAWVHGSWDVTAGGMFDDIWTPEIHVVEPFDVPPGWRVDRSFDWGSTKPFSVGWWAQSDGSDYVDRGQRCNSTVRGDLYRIGEWYGGQPDESNVGLKLLSPQIAEGIIERELDMGIHERVLPGPADPSIFTETDGKSIAGNMAQIVRVRGQQHKGPTFTAADNSRVAGWSRVRDMLFNAKPGPEGMRELPGLFVTQNCAKFLDLFPGTQRDADKTDDVDSDTEDHLQDDVRYRCKAAQLGMVGTGRVAGPVAGASAQSSTNRNPRHGRVIWR